MRLSNLFGVSASDHEGAAGVTIDVMTGIVAGVAMVLAILILAASVKQAQAEPAPTPILTDLR
jgi:hypothetical protein